LNAEPYLFNSQPIGAKLIEFFNDIKLIIDKT
jgi:hypothetical protein